MTQEEEKLESYIRISQYLAHLSTGANPFVEVRQILKSELGPRHVCFFTPGPTDHAVECHEGCCHKDSCVLPRLLEPESLAVLEDQFIDTTFIEAAPGGGDIDPLSVIFLSLPVKHHPPCVMSVAYSGKISFEKTTLNIYLGIAGMVATALDRRTNEAERMADLAARQKVLEELAVAEATLRTRGTFYAGISHDIRSPVAAIRSLSELLLEDDPRPGQEELLKSIYNSTENLLGLLSDVMDFSRMEVGKLQISSVPFDPLQVAVEITQLLAEQAHQKALEFHCDTGKADPGPYLGDPLRIRQVLMNLLTNAIKFTPRGSVSLVLRTESSNGCRDRVVFEVADTGIGIPEDKLKHIFGSFQQADDQTAARYGGSGLGLAICQSLVDLMQGEIRVTSSEEGSRFVVSIPLERAKSS